MESKNQQTEETTKNTSSQSLQLKQKLINSLSNSDLNLIIMGLGKLPAEKSFNLLVRMHAIIAEQK